MKVVNLTPHSVVLDDGNQVKEFSPSGIIPRVTQTFEKVQGETPVPLATCEWGEVENLPAPQANTLYIVSAMVADAARDRDDLLVPATGKAKRNERGHIISVPFFITKKVAYKIL